MAVVFPAPPVAGRIYHTCRTAGRQAAGRRQAKRPGAAAGRQYAIEYRSTLIMRDFYRLFPYDKQLIISIPYDTEQKNKTVRHSQTDSQKTPDPAADPPGKTAGTGSRQQDLSVCRRRTPVRVTNTSRRA